MDVARKLRHAKIHQVANTELHLVYCFFSVMIFAFASRIACPAKPLPCEPPAALFCGTTSTPCYCANPTATCVFHASVEITSSFTSRVCNALIPKLFDVWLNPCVSSASERMLHTWTSPLRRAASRRSPYSTIFAAPFASQMMNHVRRQSIKLTHLVSKINTFMMSLLSTSIHIPSKRSTDHSHVLFGTSTPSDTSIVVASTITAEATSTGEACSVLQRPLPLHHHTRLSEQSPDQQRTASKTNLAVPSAARAGSHESSSISAMILSRNRSSAQPCVCPTSRPCTLHECLQNIFLELPATPLVTGNASTAA